MADQGVKSGGPAIESPGSGEGSEVPPALAEGEGPGFGSPAVQSPGSGNGIGEATAPLGEAAIREALAEVYDPEIGIDIVSLGLVYGTTIDAQGKLTVDMTLTSPYCPMGGLIQDQVSAICAPLPGVEEVKVNFVFKPSWDPRTMASDEAKLDLGIY